VAAAEVDVRPAEEVEQHLCVFGGVLAVECPFGGAVAEDALERLGVLEAGQRIVVVGGEVEHGGGAVVEAGEETEVPVGPGG
jgi:hypothetical protein